jgi:hypothetical protein
VALDKSQGSAEGKLLLGGALESALEIELRGKYHNYIEHREKTSFPRGRIEIGKSMVSLSKIFGIKARGIGNSA